MSDKDTIYRQEAIDALNTRAKDTFTLADGYQYYLGALHDVADDLRRLPSAQLDIIRCKDCKNYRIGHDGLMYCYAHDGDSLWQDDDFCSRAERRTNETD